MNTTDNYRAQPKDEDDAKLQQMHSETGVDPNGTPDTADPNPDPDNLVKAEVSAPLSESQVQQGREVVDGNGLRETNPPEPTRPDTLVDEDADTVAKQEREHAQTVQDKENGKLRTNSKPGVAASEDDK